MVTLKPRLRIWFMMNKIDIIKFNIKNMDKKKNKNWFGA